VERRPIVFAIIAILRARRSGRGRVLDHRQTAALGHLDSLAEGRLARLTPSVRTRGKASA
jgi:hypothetical protein